MGKKKPKKKAAKGKKKGKKPTKKAVRPQDNIPAKACEDSEFRCPSNFSCEDQTTSYYKQNASNKHATITTLRWKCTCLCKKKCAGKCNYTGSEATGDPRNNYRNVFAFYQFRSAVKPSDMKTLSLSNTKATTFQMMELYKRHITDRAKDLKRNQPKPSKRKPEPKAAKRKPETYFLAKRGSNACPSGSTEVPKSGYRRCGHCRQGVTWEEDHERFIAFTQGTLVAHTTWLLRPHDKGAANHHAPFQHWTSQKQRGFSESMQNPTLRARQWEWQKGGETHSHVDAPVSCAGVQWIVVRGSSRGMRGRWLLEHGSGQREVESLRLEKMLWVQYVLH